MPRKPRSLKQQMDRLTAELRAAGWTWTQIAAEYQRRYRLNPRQAFREAHRLTQAAVTARWDALWPDEPLSVRKLAWWEAWPGPTGHEPPLAALNRLARIYQCRTIDLIEGEDHTADDANTPHPADSHVRPIGHAARPTSPVSLTFDDIQDLLSSLPPQPSAASAGGLLRREFDELVDALTRWAERMRRRDALALLGAAATSAYASPVFDRLNPDDLERLALAVADPARVDGATVAHIEAILHHSMRQEYTLGPHSALETVLAQRHLVHHLLAGGAKAPIRDRLLSVLANLSRCTGWMLFNLNDFNAAEHYLAQARTAAHQANDDAVAALILANLSQLATWRGDPRQGLDHALAAVEWARRAGSRLLAAYAHDVEARAHAGISARSAASDRRSGRTRCLRALDQAHAALTRITSGDPAAGLVYNYCDANRQSTGSSCLITMNFRPAQALDMARTALTRIAPAVTHSIAFTHVWIARAHLNLRDIDETCAALAEAAALTQVNVSARLTRSILETREKLSPWSSTRPVIDLDDRLHTLGLRPSQTPTGGCSAFRRGLRICPTTSTITS
jgi:hypothetical protein